MTSNSTNMNSELPNFVKEGTFTWTRLGYHYKTPPSEDLLSPSALSSSNPWIVVAAVLEHAKNGDHTQINLLKNWFTYNSLGKVCLLITGDAGTRQDLSQLKTLIETGPDDVRCYSCIAAADAGALWLIPSMLNAWHDVKGLSEHEIIGFAISDILEYKSTLDDMGPIAEHASLYDISTPKNIEKYNKKLQRIGKRFGELNKNHKFDKIVQEKYNEVKANVGDLHKPIWGGKIFGVKSFAEHFYSLITDPNAKSSLWGSVIGLRRKFEAATGVDCSPFYKNDRFQQLTAAAILEYFLENGGKQNYQEGFRYFFGHKIPENNL